MTRAEVAALLAMRATYHGVQVGESDVEAWWHTIGDLDFADARIALIEHYSERREWLMPADIRQSVRRARKARLDAAPPADPPAGMDPDDTAAYRAWLAANRGGTASGRLGAEQSQADREAATKRGLAAARAAIAPTPRGRGGRVMTEKSTPPPPSIVWRVDASSPKLLDAQTRSRVCAWVTDHGLDIENVRDVEVSDDGWIDATVYVQPRRLDPETAELPTRVERVPLKSPPPELLIEDTP